MIKSAITSMEIKDNTALITVDGISGGTEDVSRIFSAIAPRGIHVDMITLSPAHRHGVDLSFTVSGDELISAVAAMGELKSAMPRLVCRISGNNAKITLSGAAVSEDTGIIAGVLSVPAGAGASVKLISASVNEISLLVDEADADIVAAGIRERFVIK